MMSLRVDTPSPSSARARSDLMHYIGHADWTFAVWSWFGEGLGFLTCGGVSNPCAFGRSAGCWGRTRSTTSATRSESSRLAVLVYDRTQAVAPTAGFFLVAKFLPALLRAGADRAPGPLALRRSAAGALRGRGRRLRRPGASCRRRPLLPAARARARADRRHAGDHRPRPDARRRGGVLQPRGLLSEGNALMNLGFALSSVFGAALAGLLDRGVRRLGRAARRRRLVPGDRDRPRRDPRPAARPSTRTASRGASASATGCDSRARHGACDAADRPVAGADLLHARRPDRGHLRQGEPRHHERRLRHPARRPGAPGSCSAACSSSRSSSRSGVRADRCISSAAVGFAYLGMSTREHAARGVPDLGRRRRRQRRPVGRRDDRAAGGDARRVPGADVRPAGVARRRDARRRLPARRRDRRARLPAHRVRGRRRGRSWCWCWSRRC